jgi:hypothetical protein
MARKFIPKPPTDDYRVPMPTDLGGDLKLIAAIRTEVNRRVGDKKKISVTEMLLEGAEDIRDSQFADWGGKPTTDDAVEEIIERETKAAREKLPVLPPLSILGDKKKEEPAAEPKKKPSAAR